MGAEDYRVPGFKAASTMAGIKKPEKLDLTLIYSERTATVAGYFTTSKVKAAPVLVSQENIRHGRVRAVIANSGNANACSGEEGLLTARRSVALVAEELRIDPTEVLVASTGVIGTPLNLPSISAAIPHLVKSLEPDGITRAAEAIMTTDSFPKVSRHEGVAGGKPYRIVGIAKGAGMIMPNMATMLSFVMSDIEIGETELRDASIACVESTFNRISVDGDTSTNDTVLVMANGLASNGALAPPDYEGFRSGLKQVMGELAIMIVKDGEGATKVVRIQMKGAHTNREALNGARTLANSLLVKTAFYGQDPNWGRIMAALGRADIQMRAEDVDIWVDDVRIVSGGLGSGLDAERAAAEKMRQEEFVLTIDLHQGAFEEQILTCDLTHDYIKINADYRT
jgi:glutamate N-acetyltransferase/amino-acid N-acetyltransferase